VPVSPAGGAPAQKGQGSKRAWLVAAAASLVAVAAVAGLLLTRDDEQAGDDPTPPGGSGQATTTLGTDPSGGTTTTVDPLGGILEGADLEDIDLVPDDEPLEPLPGDDWNPDARVRFVEDCQPSVAATASITGADPASLCGCAYDEISTSGVSFSDFNEQWAAEDIDTTSPAAQAMQSAFLGCATAAAGG
jgi:hypothetical protein